MGDAEFHGHLALWHWGHHGVLRLSPNSKATQMNRDVRCEAAWQANNRENSNAIITSPTATNRRSLDVAWVEGIETCWRVPIRCIRELSQNKGLVRRKSELSE